MDRERDHGGCQIEHGLLHGGALAAHDGRRYLPQRAAQAQGRDDPGRRSEDRRVVVYEQRCRERDDSGER